METDSIPVSEGEVVVGEEAVGTLGAIATGTTIGIMKGKGIELKLGLIRFSNSLLFSLQERLR